MALAWSPSRLLCVSSGALGSTPLGSARSNRRGGASQVLATDRAEQRPRLALDSLDQRQRRFLDRSASNRTARNLDCVRKSARLNGAELKTQARGQGYWQCANVAGLQVFDVMSKDHLPPSSQGARCFHEILAQTGARKEQSSSTLWRAV